MVEEEVVQEELEDEDNLPNFNDILLDKASQDGHTIWECAFGQLRLV